MRAEIATLFFEFAMASPSSLISSLLIDRLSLFIMAIDCKEPKVGLDDKSIPID
jgi:hypothetical protein